MIAASEANTLRTGALDFFDRVFLNEISQAVEGADRAYASMQFREVRLG